MWIVGGFSLLLLTLSSGTAVASSPPFSVSYQCGQTSGWTVPPPPANGSTLKQVIAIIRHGDRTAYNGSQCWLNDTAVWRCSLIHGGIPIDTSQDGLNDFTGTSRIFGKVYMPTREVIKGNCSVGQLTSIGYTQHMANGGSLHDAYVKTGFLKPSLDPLEVFIRSDDVPRTILSAQSLIQGMFPSTDDRGPIQQVPLYTRDRVYDTIEANGVLCPKNELYKKEFYTSKVWLDHKKNVTDPVIATASKVVGFDVGLDLDHFVDCLQTHYCHGYPWPAGVTEELYQSVWNENTWQKYNLLKYPSVQKNAQTGIGFLLKDIWNNLNDSVYSNGHQLNHKFYLYSGHDSTLMQLLVALQLDEDDIWPPYASMMLIELYSTPRAAATVRIVYNGQVKKLQFCNGGGQEEQELCDYSIFTQYLSTVTPDNDYVKNCKI